MVVSLPVKTMRAVTGNDVFHVREKAALEEI